MGALRQSHVQGDTRVALIEQTIGRSFDAAVDRWPDRAALIAPSQDIRWTYRELADEVSATAAGLLELGLTPGDRVGIWSPNNAEWVVTQFATAAAGLILVNINPAYRMTELEYALNMVGCKALVCATKFKSSDYLQMLRELAPEIDAAAPGNLRSGRLPHLRLIIHLGGGKLAGMINFRDIRHGANQALRRKLSETQRVLKCDDPINIQFTSGTTGAPKGATLTHRNILNNGHFVGEALKLDTDDRVCIPVPLYHCFGMVMGNLACMTHGAAVVLPGEGFDPLAVLQTIEAEKCTALYGVPTMFIAELEHPDFSKFDLTSLRTGIMAGTACPIETMKRTMTDMHLNEITIAYGMTETSPVSFQTSHDDPVMRRVATVGRIHPHVEVKIIDEGEHVVPIGQVGELCTRGYSVMQGYWQDKERTNEVIDIEGWMHSGDLATLDEAGYCNIVGRIKDMVIRGGENIYPREIEEFLHTHPQIEDVQVIGVPDEKYGEELCAWIKLRVGGPSQITVETLNAEGLHAFCHNQIAHFKIPRYVKFVDAFPMTVTGKIQKFIMRETMIEELGLIRQVTA